MMAATLDLMSSSLLVGGSRRRAPRLSFAIPVHDTRSNQLWAMSESGNAGIMVRKRTARQAPHVDACRAFVDEGRWLAAVGSLLAVSVCGWYVAPQFANQGRQNARAKPPRTRRKPSVFRLRMSPRRLPSCKMWPMRTLRCSSALTVRTSVIDSRSTAVGLRSGALGTRPKRSCGPLLMKAGRSPRAAQSWKPWRMAR